MQWHLQFLRLIIFGLKTMAPSIPEAYNIWPKSMAPSIPEAYNI